MEVLYKLGSRGYRASVINSISKFRLAKTKSIATPFLSTTIKGSARILVTLCQEGIRQSPYERTQNIKNVKELAKYSGMLIFIKNKFHNRFTLHNLPC